jgi:hypothetical protein
MALKSAEQVLLFDVVFIVLLASYGAATTGLGFNALQSIPPPPVAPQPDISCNGLCSPLAGLTQATAYIGWAVVNLPALLAWLVAEFVLFANLILLVTFNPSFSSNGVPVVGFFFVALQSVVLFEIFRMFRGSASGM